ncbi:hypothetical protein BBP40_012380 [Aspergillus hancockii]|nr:hypothetical protein BBP40_012380 [Aspergillus hancockii]
MSSESQPQWIDHDAVPESKSRLIQGQRFREQNELLKGTIDQLLEDKAKLTQDFEELHQEHQRTIYELRTALSNFQTQEAHVRRAEGEYEQAAEDLKRFKLIFRKARKKTEGLKDGLRLRDQTIDELRDGLQEKDSVIATYEYQLRECNSYHWVDDLTEWYRNMKEERDMLREVLYRVVGMCEGMEKTFIEYMGFPSAFGDGNEQNLGDRMSVDLPDTLAEGVEGSSGSFFQDNAHEWCSPSANGEDVMSDPADEPMDICRPPSEPRNDLTLEEEMRRAGNPGQPGSAEHQANGEEDSEREYEPPVSLSSSLPTNGSPKLEEKETSEDSSQFTTDEVDTYPDSWHHMLDTFFQGATDGSDTLLKGEILDLYMPDVEPLQEQRGMDDKMNIDPEELVWGWQRRARGRKLPPSGNFNLHKKSKLEDSVMDDMLTDEQIAILNGEEIIMPKKSEIPDRPLSAPMTVNMFQFDIPSTAFPATCSVPQSEPLAVPSTSSSQESTDAGEDKHNVGSDAQNAVNLAGTQSSAENAGNAESADIPKEENSEKISSSWKSFRPKYTGVVHFPDKVKAQVPQQRPPPKVQPLMGLRRIKISPSLQVAGYQAVHDAAVVANPSIPPVTYDLSHFYMKMNGELVPVQDPYIYAEEEIPSVTEQSYSEECDTEWHNQPRTSASIGGTKWWLLLFCIAFLYCMWPQGKNNNNQRWMEANKMPRNLRTMMQESRDSEFEFIQMLTYKMAKRSGIDPVALG